MNCRVCGTPLPPGVAFCPNCGTPTSSSYPEAGSAPTIASAPPPPPTNYGPQSYGAAPSYPPPTVPYDPYSAAPPPPTPQRRGNRPGLILGIVLLVVILIVGGLVALLLRGSQVTVTPAQATATAQATMAQATTLANATATAQVIAHATATATALQNIYTQATSGTPALSDPLSNQDSNRWDQGSLCVFNGGAYHVNESMPNNFAVCAAGTSNFQNFALQVEMVMNKGDWGGIFFRSDSTVNNFYYWEVHQDGSYALKIYKNNSYLSTLVSGTSTAFTTGLGPSNTMTLVAQGSTIALYINGKFVDTTTDTNFSSGEIGLTAGDDMQPTDVSFSNLKVWKL